MRNLPTPARANNDASAEPVAPHPTIATLPAPTAPPRAASRRWPSAPIPRNRICREYRSPNFSFSSSTPCLKEVTSSFPQNLYYKCDRLSHQCTGQRGPTLHRNRKRPQGNYLLRRYASFVILIVVSLAPTARAGSSQI